MGVGGAGVLGAIVTGLVVSNRKSTVGEHCVNKVCDQTGLDAAASGRSWVRANTAFWAVGVLGTAAGVTLLWTDPQRRTGIVVHPSPHGASMAFGGTL